MEIIVNNLSKFLTYMQIFHIGNVIFYTMLGISGVLLIYKIILHIVGLFPSKKFADAKTNHKFGIVIAARNESKVIGQLLESIKNQTYDKNLIHTYVVVESADDPTNEIAKKYENTTVVIREHLELKGKGHALDEAFQYIIANHEEKEAYFIFDADNILNRTYVEEMNKCYDAGYEMALAYRNSKNWNDGWVAASSALTFSMINTFQNKCRSRFNSNVIVSGTGFYISNRVIKEMGGWKFFTLTEDYEISMFSALNNIKSTYNEYAEFYDEQPTTLKVSWNQRIRWIKGFNQTNKKYKKKLVKSAIVDSENRLSKIEFSLSILPIISLLITIIIYLIFTLAMTIIGLILSTPYYAKALIAFASSAAAVYGFLATYTLMMILAERKHINIKFKNALSCILMNPLYMAIYIPIYIQALFTKEVKWVPIEHKVTVNIDDLKK